MPHTNFCSNPPKGSEKEAVFFFFFFQILAYMGMTAILVMSPRPFDDLFLPSHKSNIL